MKALHRSTFILERRSNLTRKVEVMKQLTKSARATLFGSTLAVSLVLIASLGSAAPLANHQTAATKDSKTVMLKHEYADVNGVKLHYVTAGKGELVMFVHGFPEFWYEWKNQLLEYGKNFQAVAPDMR